MVRILRPLPLEEQGNVTNVKKKVGQIQFKELMQTGKLKSIPRDRGRLALMPGKRISKTGNIYWETRINRSDALGGRV